ncbi:MAG: hypothetical protein AAFX50_18530, partial [Acidobacteriota bacterium]
MITAPPIREQMLLLDAGNPELVDGEPAPGGFMPLSLRRETAAAHPAGLGPTFDLEGDLLYVHIRETVRQPLVDVQLQFRDSGVATWGSLDVSRFLIEDGELVDPTQHELDMLVDVGGLPALSSKELRIRAVDAGGAEHVSVRFRVADRGSCQPVVFRGLLTTSEPELEADECYDRDAIRQAVGEMVDEQGLDPMRQDIFWVTESITPAIDDAELIIRSDEDPDFAVPVRLRPVAERDGVLLLTTELDCFEYSINVRVTTEPVEIPATGSVEPLVFTDRSPDFDNEDSCLAIGHSVLIQQAAACGVEPPGAAVVVMRAIGEGLEVLRLEDSLGRSVFTQVAPVSGTLYETEIDFDALGLADGVHDYVISASNSLGRTRSVDVSVPVDRTPPTVEFVSPGEGALVCANVGPCLTGDDGRFKPDVPRISLESSVDEAFPGTLTPAALDKIFSRTPAGDDTGLRPLFGSS